jgi:hypothetical protein
LRKQTLSLFSVGELKRPQQKALGVKVNGHVNVVLAGIINNFHISEISTTKKVFGVVDCFSVRSYNRFAKAFTSSES